MHMLNMDRSCESVLLPRVAQMHVKCNAYVEYGPFLWVGFVIQSRSDACKIQMHMLNMDRSCESVLLPRVAQMHVKCNAYVE